MSKTLCFFCVITIFFFNTTLNAAGIPPININLSSGAGTNLITISQGQKAVVEYKIQDVIGRPPSRTWSWASPIPSYITRTASIHQPDCAIYHQPNSNPNSFSLPPNGVCYFAFQVDGTQFAAAAKGITADYRPMYINSNGVSYGPCQSEIVSINLVPEPELIGAVVAAGSYNDSSNIKRPLLAFSQDSGSSWTFPEFINAPQFTTYPFADGGEFSSSSCSGKMCIAAGSYCTGSSCSVNYALAESRPLLALTNDSGSTWSYPESITMAEFTPSDTHPLVRGAFIGASCNGSTCIAVGTYQDDSISRPFLALSKDSGSSWSYPESVTAPVFTINSFESGFLYSANCNASTCIAVGDYYDNSLTDRPLLTFSNDSGNTWNFPESITAPVFTTNFFKEGWLNSVNCYEKNCVAVGVYIDVSNIMHPLLALSKDSGSTWTYSESITTPVLSPSFADYGTFYDVNCYGTTCIAVGSYTDIGGKTRPLLASSHDSGSNWSYSDSISTPVLNTHPFDNEGTFYSVSCNGSTCVAVGSYKDANSDTFPLLASSNDSGNTWSYSESVTSPVFTPSNTYPFIFGTLNSVRCNRLVCVAGGQYDDGDVIRPFLAQSNDAGNTWNYPESISVVEFTPANSNPFKNSGRFNMVASANFSFLPDSLKFMNPKRVEKKYSLPFPRLNKRELVSH